MVKPSSQKTKSDRGQNQIREENSKATWEDETYGSYPQQALTKAGFL
jgi:hypothetical protein